MKKLLLLLFTICILPIISISQITKEGEPIKTDIVYVSPNRDTMFISKTHYELYNIAWDIDIQKHKDLKKPTLIKIESMEEFYAKIED